ncbi:MAG: sulfite exporter TauE/SafE family protein [Campylobacterota bacterium]|nr:sulfite exporter TauE/SafE family protein [Campylobacterota bacterium]
MILDLSIFGVVTGFVSGFFGVGGGMILVPMLLVYGFDMKQAVSISIMQMVFSSIYGSFLNAKKYTGLLKDGSIIGIGGFIGGFQSSLVHSLVSNQVLEYLFVFIVVFAIYKIATSSAHGHEVTKKHNKIALFFIGLVIGLVAMSIGVGGSVMLTPILVAYLHYNLKTASSLGLFFVIFSSVAGFSSQALAGEMLYNEGLIVGLSSLVGVYLGIKVKHIINIKSYKVFILTLYVIILFSMLYTLGR